MCVRVYTDLYILSSFSLEPRCSLVYPRRNVEFKRITETRRRGEEANNIHPLLPSIRFTRLSSRHVLKPKSFFYFKLHTCLVRVVSSISPSSWYREPVVCTERYSHTHPHTDPRARSLASSRATHEKRERERKSARDFSSSHYPLTRYERDNLFAMQITSDRC